MKGIARYIKWFVIGIVLIIILIIASCFIFEDQLLQKAEESIAKKLDTEINTSALDLDPFSHFPYFTFSLDQLEIAGNDKKTFLKAHLVECLINPLSTLSDEIDISRIILRDGEINLRKHSDKWNFDFGSDNQQSSDSQKGLQLGEIQIIDLSLSIDDASSDLHADLKVGEFLGSLFLNEQSTIIGNMTLLPENLKLAEYSATANEPISITINASSDDKSTVLKQLDVEIADNTIELAGEFNQSLDIDGSVDIEDSEKIKSWIPEAYHQLITDDSHIDFTLTGESENPDSKVKIKNEQLQLDLSKKGDKIYMDGNMASTFLNAFQKDMSFTSGEFLFSQMQINNQNPTLESLSGTMSIKDVELIYLEKPVELSSKEIQLNRGNCNLTDLQVQIADSDINYSGMVDYTDSSYKLKGLLFADKIIASDFLSMMQDSSESEFSMEGDFVLEIRSLENNEWEGENITGKLLYNEKKLTYEVALESFDGNIESKGTIKNETLLHFKSNSTFSDLEIEDLLDQLNNLGQEMISSDNMSGSLSGHAMLDLYFDEEMNPDRSTSHALVAVQAKDGKLEDFKLLEDFSKYIDIDDLRNVRFDDMTNYFEWKGDHLVIPIIFIKNNAANFLISGYHNMENEFLYHLQLNASEVLAKKFGKKKRAAKKKGWWNMYYIAEGDMENFEVHSEKDRVKAGLNRSLIEKEEIFDKLVSVFGYSDVLKSVEDWEDL
jgi:hypothetical protein